jgi:hypothetical protein
MTISTSIIELRQMSKKHLYIHDFNASLELRIRPILEEVNHMPPPRQISRQDAPPQINRNKATRSVNRCTSEMVIVPVDAATRQHRAADIEVYA